MSIRPFSLLVKPAGPSCNLNCTYCFYLDKQRLFPGGATRMTAETLEHMIASYMATSQPVYQFGWQGGEPTLMGVAFFRQVVAWQQKHGRPGSTVSNGLQTNGTRLTPEFARLLAEYNFLLGVSLDGPAEIHNHFRRDRTGNGTHTKALEGLAILRDAGVETNILVLVSAANAGHAAEVYRYLMDLGYPYQQYIPCVEMDGQGNPQPFAVTPESWGSFLCELFDAWDADGRRASIRLFDAILARLAYNRIDLCHFGEDCRHYFVVEHDGGVYPCDFFVEKKLRLGNVAKADWGAWLESPRYKEFGARKMANAKTCKTCPARAICRGDCPKHRPGGPGSVSHLCEGWRRFFRHALPRLRELANTLPK